MVYDNWQAALATILNPDVRSFVQRELGAGQKSRFQQARLVYEVGGKRRWNFNCRQRWARVWQVGRFDGDVQFWGPLLDDAGSIELVKGGQSLAFSLTSARELQAFKDAVGGKLHSAKWVERG